MTASARRRNRRNPTMHQDLTAAEVGNLRRELLSWFDRHRRDLPWRRHRTVFGTWVAEIMLQQTTVAAVVPFWERFLARFPDVASLAAAPEADVLTLWSGLGYYRRARLLHRAARRIVEEHGGRLPETRDGWSALPGIGDYASGAIASLAAGERVPAVDANARRVLTRWLTDSPRVAANLRPRVVRDLADRMVPGADPGRWNEAVMELGALVCRAREPRCEACPVTTHCRAGRAGTAREIPPPAARPPATPVALSMLILRVGDGMALWPPSTPPAVIPSAGTSPLRTDLSGLHRGLWGLPTTPWYRRDDVDFPGSAPAAWAGYLACVDRDDVPQVRVLGTVSHTITRWRLEVTVCRAELPPIAFARRLVRTLGAQIAHDPARRPLSRLVKKVIEIEGVLAFDR